jgi:hypothetical protein
MTLLSTALTAKLAEFGVRVLAELYKTFHYGNSAERKERYKTKLAELEARRKLAKAVLK